MIDKCKKNNKISILIITIIGKIKHNFGVFFILKTYITRLKKTYIVNLFFTY